MNELLLLGRDPGCTDELTGIFQSAGYDVVEVKDVLSCCRQLRVQLPAPPNHKVPSPNALPLSAQHRGITIFNAPALNGSGSDGASSRNGSSSYAGQLRDCIVTLARQLTPGWRLSMRHHHLEAPDGTIIELTSLEFSFIKIFAMVDVGHTVSRKQIVQAFGEDYLSYDQNRIDTMVRRLRQKIEAAIGLKLPLNTERVRGFSFGDVLIIDL